MYSRAVRLGEDDDVVALDLLLHEVHRVHRSAGPRKGEVSRREERTREDKREEVKHIVVRGGAVRQGHQSLETSSIGGSELCRRVRLKASK